MEVTSNHSNAGGENTPAKNAPSACGAIDIADKFMKA